MKEMKIILKKVKMKLMKIQINYEEFNYLDELEEKEKDKIIELFDELKLDNNIKE